MIETTRLKLYPATRQQMEAWIAAEQDPEMQKAYGEMLQGCLQRPEQWDWYAMWMIELRDGTHVGDLCFKGLGDDGVAEIGYGIDPACQCKGYATEAVEAMLDWAFSHDEVTAVVAETDPGNGPSQRVLAKCGFVPNGKMGEEGPRFTRPRPQAR